MYTDALASALAEVLSRAIHRMEVSEGFWQDTKVQGLENILVNQVAIEAGWEVTKVWELKKPSHINIQETVSVLKVASKRETACEGCCAG